MNELLAYFEGGIFVSYMEQVGVPFILIALGVALVALLLEIRLPLRYYWDLPGHGLRSVLQGLRLLKPHPIWGTSVVQATGKPLPLVACELLDSATNKVVMRTYSNHAGKFGFKLAPGKYLLRAVKNHYRLPSFLDPENVRIIGVDESFVVPVIVVNKEVAPSIDLPLVPVKRLDELTKWQNLVHYVRMFLFQLANALLGLVIILSLLGLWVEQDPFYGVVVAVSVTLLFIKLYILETISTLVRSSHA